MLDDHSEYSHSHRTSHARVGKGQSTRNVRSSFFFYQGISSHHRSVSHYDYQQALVTLEFYGATVQVDISNLLSSNDLPVTPLRADIGQVVHVIGYVTQHHQALVVQAIMYWSAGRMNNDLMRRYREVILARRDLHCS